MIDIEAFTSFLKETFEEKIIYFDKFKPELFFLEIDCLKNTRMKLSIEVSPDSVKVSSVDKKPSIDFSLHDYSFNNDLEAKSFLLEIHKTGVYIPHS